MKWVWHGEATFVLDWVHLRASLFLLEEKLELHLELINALVEASVLGAHVDTSPLAKRDMNKTAEKLMTLAAKLADSAQKVSPKASRSVGALGPDDSGPHLFAEKSEHPERPERGGTGCTTSEPASCTSAETEWENVKTSGGAASTG